MTERREIGGAKREVSQAKWIHTREVKDRLAVNVLLDDLDLGEAETIILALKLNADWVLIGQVGLLPTIRQDIEALHQRGFSISQSVMEAVLQQAGELY